MSQMTAPVEVAGSGGWRRLSPRMLLVHPVVELGRALPALVGLLLAGTTSGGGSRWSLVGAGVVILFALTRWFTTRFRITSDQVLVRRGLIRRVTVAAPLERVRTVDVTAHLLHRALGLAKVAIGTGISDRKGRGGLVLDGLDAGEAAHLRYELLHRAPAVRALPRDAATTVETRPEEEELLRLGPAWLRYAPFTLSGALTGLALLGVGWRVVTEGHVDLSRIGPLRAVGDQLGRWPLGVAVGVVLLSVILFVAVASTVGYVLAFWGFRLTRHDGGTLHVARGLLTTRATSIERRRLRGVTLSTPLLLRAVGGARCLAITTGLRVGRGAERGGEILVPPGPVGVTDAVAAQVLGTLTPLTLPLRRHPLVARRRRVLRAVMGALVLTGLLGLLSVATALPGWAVLSSFALVAVAVPLGLDRYRALGHALIGGYLVTRSGSLNRRRDVLACDGIIGWNFHSSLFQRRAGLTTLVATTAAGRQGYHIIDVALADAECLADAALPELLGQFRWSELPMQQPGRPPDRFTPSR